MAFQMKPRFRRSMIILIALEQCMPFWILCFYTVNQILLHASFCARISLVFGAMGLSAVYAQALFSGHDSLGFHWSHESGLCISWMWCVSQGSSELSGWWVDGKVCLVLGLQEKAQLNSSKSLESKVILFGDLMDSHSLFLTGNTDA